LFCFVSIKSYSCPTTLHEGAWWEKRYSSYSFLTSALDGGEWSALCPDCPLAPRTGHALPIVQEAGWTPEPIWTQRLEEKSFHGCRGSNPDRPVRSQTLYWLSYPGSLRSNTYIKTILLLLTVTIRYKYTAVQVGYRVNRLLRVCLGT
jgi:hypothetical protein